MNVDIISIIKGIMISWLVINVVAVICVVIMGIVIKNRNKKLYGDNKE